MKRKALVIDDDVYCLDISVEYLTGKDFAVTSALRATCPRLANGLETCPMTEPCYDFILSDNNMPDMTGLEFFLEQQNRGCKIPSAHKALISGDISAADMAMAKKMGYTVFQKPCLLETLDQWIDSICPTKP